MNTKTFKTQKGFLNDLFGPVWVHLSDGQLTDWTKHMYSGLVSLKSPLTQIPQLPAWFLCQVELTAATQRANVIR